MGFKDFICELLVILGAVAIAFVTVWFTHDACIIVVSLTLYYWLIPKIYDKVVAKFRFESEWGQALGQGQLFTVRTLAWWLGAAIITIGLWC